MEVIYSTHETRAQNPIFVYIHKATQRPEIVVIDTGRLISFTVAPTYKSIGSYEANFWMEREGVYQINVSDQRTEKSQIIQVKPQIFLTFFQEYGLFNFLFVPLFVFIFLWSKSRLKTDGRYEK